MIRFEGRVFRSGKFWAIEVPILDVVTQGRTKKDALIMIADAIEVLANRPGFSVTVYPGAGGYFEVGSSNEGTMTALLLRRQRVKHGMTLADVAKQLGAKSLNAYARYEQGRATPTVQRLSRLLSAVSAGRGFLLREAQASKVA